jgi:hypothetical protein
LQPLSFAGATPTIAERARGTLDASKSEEALVPLYEVVDSELVGFRLLRGGAELYEKEIEDLLWNNLDDFTGESWFRIRRQAPIAGGGRPDIVALDQTARVVVIEVKRDLDRGQLAQSLEYAGWAKKASLDELAAMYHRGSGAFFADWQEFTESEAPVIINPSPRLVLVAREFHDRTFAAFEFLTQGRLPVQLIRVSMYEDAQGRRFLDVEGEFEPDLDDTQVDEPADHTRIAGRRVRIADLLDAELLTVGDTLTWTRPRLGHSYKARVNDAGAIELEDGRAFTSPSLAAMRAADIVSYDGWYAWRVDRTGKMFDELRRKLAEASQS